MPFALFAIVFLLLPSVACAWEARVANVHDGDTITVTLPGHGAHLRIRLYGIDAPELAQAGGREAAGALRGMLPIGRRVDVRHEGEDRYQRIIGVVTPLGEAMSVNERMVVMGHAWVYAQYCKRQSFCAPLYAQQKYAAATRRGLWAEQNPQSPWTWRRERREGAGGTPRQR